MTVKTRGVHRTLTPRSQTLFHRLGTIPVEWEWLDWTRILAPYILAHDSLVPSLICAELRSLGTRPRPQMPGKSNCKPLHPPSGTPCTKFYRYFHWLRDVEKCLDPSLSWSAQNFDDWLTLKLTDRTDCLGRLLQPNKPTWAHSKDPKGKVIEKESLEKPSVSRYAP